MQVKNTFFREKQKIPFKIEIKEDLEKILKIF